MNTQTMQEKPMPIPVDRTRTQTPIYIRPENRRGSEDITRS